MPASADAPLPEPAHARESALRLIWDEHRAGVLAKLTLIERAVAAMGTGELDEPHLVQARRSAHMLSGSLGMFGFTRASEAARELELELGDGAGARAPHALAPALSALVAIVRRGLDAGAFAPRDVDSVQLGGERFRLLVVDEDRDLCARIKAESTGSPPRT